MENQPNPQPKIEVSMIPAHKTYAQIVWTMGESFGLNFSTEIELLLSIAGRAAGYFAIDDEKEEEFTEVLITILKKGIKDGMEARRKEELDNTQPPVSGKATEIKENT